jgi:hypothetical protein
MKKYKEYVVEFFEFFAVTVGIFMVIVTIFILMKLADKLLNII